MSKFWEKFIRPIMFALDAERAHEIGIEAMRLGLASIIGSPLKKMRTCGEVERFGLRFANPVGVAAGFDKNGRVVNQLANLGFGFVEVGTVTYEPQQGNPKPRLFRLPEDGALINRLGFNNDGAIVIAERLKNLRPRCIVGVNIGKNKNVPIEEATSNYVKSFELIHPFADYIAVNISSPNTPNLRELQREDHLEVLLKTLQDRNQALSFDFGRKTFSQASDEVGVVDKKPLLIKIAPDLTETEIEIVVDVCLRYDVAGIIATNTTISRDGLLSKDLNILGLGGLSGRPLAERSTEVISTIYRYSKGKLPIIGVGGIFSAQDAFEKICAGASLIQVYTGFVYGGPSFARHLNTGLSYLLKERGFKSIDEASGSAHSF